MLSSRRKFLATLLALPLLSACSKPAPKLRIGTNFWPGYATLFIARENALLDKFNAHLIDLPDTTEVMRNLRNGSLEAGAVTLDEALTLAEYGQGFRIVSIFDESNGADVLLAKPDIHALPDLRGKRIGVESSALGAFMLARILSAAHLAPGDVIIADTPAGELERRYLDGEIDAVVTFEPIRSRLMKAGAHILFSSAQIPGEIVDVLVVSNRVIESNPEQVRQLVDAHFEALATLRAEPVIAAKIVAKVNQSTAQETLEAWQLMHLPDRKEATALLEGSLHATLERLAGIMKTSGLLEAQTRINPSDLIDTRFIKAPGA